MNLKLNRPSDLGDEVSGDSTRQEIMEAVTTGFRKGINEGCKASEVSERAERCGYLERKVSHSVLSSNKALMALSKLWLAYQL
ncbi:hypothetical protein GH714_008658 [Hevea brasiliensis]|uniref:Uncharacterized protein n=1 Tax=Hevea brasiliensis TaxID=3981 RepID=A0A6A6LJ30_HEVBR|nr:hypothetical protein GH714_008658 [Hevea brasiliensis]